jgi:hypothetical protein
MSVNAPASAEEAKAEGRTWNRSLDCEYSEATHGGLHYEIDELVMMRSLSELETSLVGEEEAPPNLHLDRAQRDYLQTELMIQMLAEMRLIRAAIIRFYRDVS